MTAKRLAGTAGVPEERPVGSAVGSEGEAAVQRGFLLCAHDLLGYLDQIGEVHLVIHSGRGSPGNDLAVAPDREMTADRQYRHALKVGSQDAARQAAVGQHGL